MKRGDLHPVTIHNIVNETIIEGIYDGIQQDDTYKKAYRATYKRIAQLDVDRCYTTILDQTKENFSDNEYDFLNAVGSCELVGFILGFQCALQFEKERREAGIKIPDKLLQKEVVSDEADTKPTV